MRLNEIKLAGFKSFVDPTTVSLPGKRSAVVGPNGCGKSNIIDAVRWVMGERSARQLRGETLTDVIFNGSHSRQPTALASIELLFDNRDGRVGGKFGDGKFASYSEIAVRREVSRDARSSYYLNGASCRLRDISDVFLGTGFGPRSYSIIEQGMISQLVEAKPEDLRAYLEEAAGTTKYKERRRETCNRIRHAEDNLARLNDIREELGKRLAHLQRQARAAERFRALREEERLRRSELFRIRIKAVDAQLGEQNAKVNALAVEYEAALASRQAIDAALEKSRAAHADQGERIDDAQSRYQQLVAETGSLEREIEFDRERLRKLDQDLAAVLADRAKLAAELDQDTARIRATRDDIAARRARLARSEADDRAAAQRLEDSQRQVRRHQRNWEDFANRRRENDSERRMRQSRSAFCEHTLRDLRSRAAKLATEPAMVADAGIDDLLRRINDSRRRADALAARIENNREATVAQRRELRERELAAAAARDAAQNQRSALQALNAVQEAALGRDANGAVEQWLDANGLCKAPRLGESLIVEHGWERAVETVLGDDVQAILVDDVDDFAAALGSLAGGRAALVEPYSAAVDAGPLPALADFAGRDSGAAGALLAGVFAAESATAAWRHRSALKPGQSIVTRDGLWLGAAWMRLNKDARESRSVLMTERELADRRAAVAEAEAELATKSRAADAVRQRMATLEEDRESAHASRGAAMEELSRLEAEHDVRRVRLEEALARSRRNAAEKQELDARIQTETEQLRSNRERLAALDAAAATLRAEGEALALLRDEEVREEDLARRQAREAHDAHHALQLEYQNLTSALAAGEAARDRLLGQRSALDARAKALREDAAKIKVAAPARRSALDAKLAIRRAAERELADLRRQRDGIEADTRAATSRRAAAEQHADAVRSRLEEVRVERGRMAENRSNLQAALKDIGTDAELARRDLPDDASDEQWTLKLEKLARRIARLGSINLAAIDEYRMQSERKQHLDSQHDDVQAALATLRGVMERIDRDTKARFKTTFDQVNEQLKTLFPAVFGGGHAYLEMTGDDWLGAGVTLTAHPPGKRTTSIHLLSGGEKAMTAVALVFAIFQLNPSPVCFLDEVDAPLDDTNVERFAELIRDMSNDVQFVVITHNKHTIEMADHLLGVTMQEAGVSRLVSVDVDKAARMAAAG